VLVAACSGGGGGDRDRDARRITTTTSRGDLRAAVTVATLNVLHGLFCEPATDWCRAPARLALVWRYLEAAGCPDLVGLQEIGPRQEELVVSELPALCDGAYRLEWGARPGPDRGMVLTRLPVEDAGLLDLANFPWEANWVRGRLAGGRAVDFLTAHFASSANNPPCDATRCPAVCAAGISTNECHAREVVEFFAQRPPAALSIVAGDLNATPDERTIEVLVDAGFVDAWSAAGNVECSARAPAGCTGGGDEPDTPLLGMDTVGGIPHDVRIDWVLARAGADCALRTTAQPLAATAADPPVDGMYWPSDHAGLVARIDCLG
jgi:endonuclease/exonuclease/phosphatase family metal-dependent hydrolase